MAEYFDSIKVEMQFDGTNWTDVSADVLAPIQVKQGIQSSDPLQRVANTGVMSFQLNNSAANSAGLLGYYSPGHTNCVTGFDIGLPVRLLMTYDGRTKCKFVGRIPANGIAVFPGELGTRKVGVTVNDWMDMAAKYEILLPQFTTNKRIDEIVPLIIADMPVQPGATSYETGDNTFSAVFDLVRPKTRAMQEFTAVAISEMGYIYITHDWDNYEILKVENKSARNATPLATDIIISTDESGFIRAQDSTYLLQETGDKLVLDETQSAWAISETHMAMTTTYNNYFCNRVTAKAYPRQEDTSNQVLFTLQKPLKLDAGETRDNYSVTYKDPSGGAARVTSRAMVDPVADTDYTMNTSEDGTGTDLTDDLTVTVTYGTNSATYTLKNDSASDGYITKLQARGKGIYTYDPVEYISSDAASEAAVGVYNKSLNLKYQDDANVAQQFADYIRFNYSQIGTVPETVTIAANLSSLHMWAFLQLEIGASVYVNETVTGIADYYLINGYSFNISQNGHVIFTWYLTPKYIYSWQLGVTGRSELGLATYIR